jgi:hypothetical protein
MHLTEVSVPCVPVLLSAQAFQPSHAGFHVDLCQMSEKQGMHNLRKHVQLYFFFLLFLFK